MRDIHFLTNILLQFFKLKSVLESSTQLGARGPVDLTRFNSWAGKRVASSILPNVKEVTLAARVKKLESKVATLEAQLQKRIDNDSDAKASQSFLAAKVQALEAKVADLESRPSQGIQN